MSMISHTNSYSSKSLSKEEIQEIYKIKKKIQLLSAFVVLLIVHILRSDESPYFLFVYEAISEMSFRGTSIVWSSTNTISKRSRYFGKLISGCNANKKDSNFLSFW